MVIHLPATSRFKSGHDPDDRMHPPEDEAPALSPSQIRDQIAARYAR